MSSTLSKKFGQFRQWTGEKLGTSDKTNVPEAFRQMELETESRKDGIEKMANSFFDYAKTLDKKSADDKKYTCLSAVSKSLIQQGKLYGDQTTYGQALLDIGTTQEQLSILQTEYATQIRKGVLYELMELHNSAKTYDALQKKFKNRRLDYDAKHAKLNRNKKENPQLEQEVQMARHKYEETAGDLERVMKQFAEREASLLEPLIAFAEDQIKYYEQAREETALLIERLKNHRNNLPPKQSLERTNSGIRDNTMSMKNPSAIESHANEIQPNIHRANTAKSMASISDTSSNVSSRQPATGKSVICQVQAIYDFDMENEGELTIKKGDLINVLQHVDSGWWMGRNERSGMEGIFPANYVSTPSAETGSKSCKTKIGAPAMKPSKSMPEISTASTSACHECGCSEFSADVFKPKKCNNCFHIH